MCAVGGRKQGKKARVSLPLEFCIKDSGPGVPMISCCTCSIRSSPPSRPDRGIGLALVAKIIGDHGGIIECESQPRHTIFRVLMPIYLGINAGPDGRWPEEDDNACGKHTDSDDDAANPHGPQSSSVASGL